MLPKFLSKYGTIDTVEYIGNPKNLKVLKKGDLIFGAEGFDKGRSIVIIEEQEKTITNIHGITIQQEEHNVEKAIFIKCFLDYLRDKGLIDLFAVGGNGGSLSQRYWEYIHFPKFELKEQIRISKIYNNCDVKYDIENWDLNNFLQKDSEFNNIAGIYELDKTLKKLKDWMIDILNCQEDCGPLEELGQFLKYAHNSKGIIIAAGARAYTDFGKKNFLKKGDGVKFVNHSL